MNAILIIVYAAFLLSCSRPEDLHDDTLTDSRDGKTYRIIEMGTQTWMAENLNYDAPGSRCYDNDSANCDKYGRLYDWATALNVCPDDWHLPTDAEWTKLTNFVGDSAAIKLKTTDGRDWNGTDNYGFSALPSGMSYDSIFAYLGFYSIWWSTIDGGNNGLTAITYGVNSYSEKDVIRQSSNKSSFISVRCIKGKPYFNIKYGDDLIDERNTQKPVTYKTVVIGEQTWMAANLNYEVSGSKCYNDYPENCERYGRLYDWEMAMTVCPVGWHLPTDEEWTILENFVGSNPGTKLKAASGWNWNDWDGISGNGTDNYGFSALPSGPGGPDGDFGYGGNFVLFWSSTGYYSTYKDVYIRKIDYRDVNIDRGILWTSAFLSVRCIKD